MGDPLRHVKPAVRALKAYTLAARQAPIKINQNENPFELPEAMKRRVVERALARPWGRYPEFDPHALTAALAEFAGWRPDGVLAGNGSNELIEALLLVTVGPGTKVVIPEPTFTLYALLTSILGGEAVRVSLGPDLEYDAETISQARRQREASVTIVCSPNNPTGGTLAREAVARLCAEGDGLVVIDEAYHEFAEVGDFLDLRNRYEHVVLLRTLSKFVSLAGVRCGLLVAAPEIVEFSQSVLPPYTFPTPSIEHVLEALSTDALRVSEERVTLLKRERARLSAALLDIPDVRKVYPSDANFVMVRTRDGQAFRETARRAGILVRTFDDPLLTNCVRITVGRPADNDLLLRAVAGAERATDA